MLQKSNIDDLTPPRVNLGFKRNRTETFNWCGIQSHSMTRGETKMLAAKALSGVAAFTFLFATATTACDDCNLCNGTGVCTKTVQVPCTVMKTVKETCYRDEQRTVKMVKVAKTITVEKEVPYEYNARGYVSKKSTSRRLEIKTPKFRWVDQEYTDQCTWQRLRHTKSASGPSTCQSRK